MSQIMMKTRKQKYEYLQKTIRRTVGVQCCTSPGQLVSLTIAD